MAFNPFNGIMGMSQAGGNENLEASIQENLSLLLNTRRYSVPHLPNFGLPDIHETYQGGADAHERLAEVISEALKTFEPRLHEVVVKPIKDPGQTARLSFSIEGKVRKGSRESTLVFQTQIFRDGRYTTTRGSRYG